MERTAMMSRTPEQQAKVDAALELIDTFATGDTEPARPSCSTRTTSSTTWPTAPAATPSSSSVEDLAAARGSHHWWQNIRAFEDGDYVFLQTVYNFAGAGEQVAFDIFRFDEDGEIAEHWDNLAALWPSPTPPATPRSTAPRRSPIWTRPRRTVSWSRTSSYDVMQGNNPDKTADYFDGDAYIQHNTAIADGVSGPERRAGRSGRAGHRDDLRRDPHGAGRRATSCWRSPKAPMAAHPPAYYDLWRVEDGKIAEHWDVMETIAPQDTWANDNGKF